MLRINQNRLVNDKEMIQINQHRLVDGIDYNQDDSLMIGSVVDIYEKGLSMTMKRLIKEILIDLIDNSNDY